MYVYIYIHIHIYVYIYIYIYIRIYILGAFNLQLRGPTLCAGQLSDRAERTGPGRRRYIYIQIDTYINKHIYTYVY